jgi:hypothetical protein
MAINMKQAELDVVMSVEIGAESRRVLNALTIPEYMEAWLQMPDAEKLWCFADRRTPNSFHIDLCSVKAPRARIKGDCLRLDPDRIIYLWRNTCIASTGATMVDIHLKGGPGQCTINLKHGGFCNMEESLWHSRMWHRSLNKLGRLMTMMNGSARTGKEAKAAARVVPKYSALTLSSSLPEGQGYRYRNPLFHSKREDGGC